MKEDEIRKIEEELGLHEDAIPDGVKASLEISDLIRELGYDSPQWQDPQDIALPKVLNCLRGLSEKIKDLSEQLFHEQMKEL